MRPDRVPNQTSNLRVRCPTDCATRPGFSKVSKGNLEPHMIRASADLQVPNRYMERNRILQAQVVRDSTCKFHGCKVFSKMDLNQSYHQPLLHPDSRAIATFSSGGNIRPKGLMFGAKSSQVMKQCIRSLEIFFIV